MRIRARAMLWHDGVLIVAELKGSAKFVELPLPSGHVNSAKSIVDALTREVSLATGPEIPPRPLLYVSEVREAAHTRELELISLAEAKGVPTLRGRFRTVGASSDPPPQVRPAILNRIMAPARRGWRGTPRWLGCA